MPYELTLPDGSKILVSDEIPKEEAEKAVANAINLVPSNDQQQKQDIFRKVAEMLSRQSTARPPEPPRLSSPFAAQAAGKFINDLMNDLRFLYQTELERYKLAKQEEMAKAELSIKEKELAIRQKELEMREIQENRNFLFNLLTKAIDYKNAKEMFEFTKQQHMDNIRIAKEKIDVMLKDIKETTERHYASLKQQYDIAVMQMQNALEMQKNNQAFTEYIELLKQDFAKELEIMRQEHALKIQNIVGETQKALQELANRGNLDNTVVKEFVNKISELAFPNQSTNIPSVGGMYNQQLVNPNYFTPSGNLGQNLFPQSQQTQQQTATQHPVTTPQVNALGPPPLQPASETPSVKALKEEELKGNEGVGE